MGWLHSFACTNNLIFNEKLVNTSDYKLNWRYLICYLWRNAGNFLANYYYKRIYYLTIKRKQAIKEHI